MSRKTEPCSTEEAAIIEVRDQDIGLATFDGENRKVLQILAAASELFLEKGYDTVSMDAIARGAAVSKATMYAHFASKEALFAALIREECKATAERMRPPSLDDARFEACLRQIADQFIDVFLDRRALAMHRIVFAEAWRFPEVRHAFLKWGPHHVQRMIAGLLEEACRRGLINLPDPHIGAIQFLSLISGDMPMEWHLGVAPPTAAEMKKLVESGIKLFLNGYSVKAGTTGLKDAPHKVPAPKR
ncbi:MAG: TetR/AcrR family transcriptional regulator [Beijerinckiaceae bacterium]|nr:TetR/AcrR family transcriptional regulator [Beijerinckiaceae bacterium]